MKLHFAENRRKIHMKCVKEKCELWDNDEQYCSMTECQDVICTLDSYIDDEEKTLDYLISVYNKITE